MKITMMFVISLSLWLASVQLLGTANADPWLTVVGTTGCDWRRADYSNYAICAQPNQPSFYPNSGLSRMFNVMIYIAEYENDYYNKRLRAYNLGHYPDMALNAISHIYGNLYIREYGDNGQFIKRGSFGPLWMRRTTESDNDYRTFWKLPGFVTYDSVSKLATFRFFIPAPAEGGDPVVDTWKSQSGSKTSYEMGITLSATCLNGLYTKDTTEATKPQRCVTDETAMSTSYMDHYAMKHNSPMSGTVEKAELRTNTFDFVYRWSAEDLNLYTRERVTGANDLKPQLRVILYDSNPASHGQDTVNEKDQKNIRVRAVLAVFYPYLPSWDSASNKPQETYSYDLSWGGWKEEALTDFLYKYAVYDHQGQDSAYYSGWNSATGLSMAISVCMKTGDLPDREGGCREWQLHPVVIKDRNPQPTSAP